MRIKILISCIFLTQFCFSQAEKDSSITVENTYKQRAYIGLSYGFAIPMGNFSANSPDELNSAYAKNGQNFHLFDFGYRFNDAFSGKAYYLSASNDVDDNLLSENLSKNSDKQYTVDASNFDLKALLVGIGISKVSNSMDLDLHFLLGIGNSFLPSFDVLVKDPQDNSEQNFLLQSAKESGLGVGLNAGFRIHLNKNFDFLTQAAYIIFEKEFERLRIDQNNSSSSSTKVSYEILTINFGFAYRFNLSDL